MIGIEVRGVGFGRRDRADRIEPDGGAANVAVEQGVEPGRALPVGQGVERRDLVWRQRRAGLWVGDGERALDPVDPVELGQLRRRSRSGRRSFARIRRRALHVGEDHDRRRLARRELGLQGDVGIPALDARRIDLRAGHALLEAQDRALRR